MRYWVMYKLDAKYVADVEADTVEEALEQAKLRYNNADFGEVQGTIGEPVSVMDENDEFVWEKKDE